MWLKIAIAVIFFFLVGSLISGFVFLIKDQGKSKRTLHSLGVRIGLAGLLMLLLAYGVISGELRSNAPWSVKAIKESSQPMRSP